MKRFLLACVLLSIAVFASLGLGNEGRADASSDCPSLNETSGALRLQQIRFRDGRCVVQATSDAVDGKYRSYSISSAGLLMVFNSFGDGPSSRDTGARAYFLFPRKRAVVSYEVLATGDVALHTASGGPILLSSTIGRIAQFPGADFDEDHVVRRENQGGLELRKTDGVVLDTGWQLGETAYSKPSRRSKFRDRGGRECEVVNSEIFLYSEGNTRLRFDTDAGLAAFLRRRCAGFDITPLVERGWAPAPLAPPSPSPSPSPSLSLEAPASNSEIPEPFSSAVRLLEKGLFKFIHFSADFGRKNTG